MDADTSQAQSLSPDYTPHLEWTDLSNASCHTDRLIHQLFEDRVDATPDAVAIVYERQSLTYAELNEKANQLARHLRSYGVRADELVGLCVERSLDLVVGLLGILKAGGAYMPLDPNYPTERLRYMLSDAAPKVLLTQGQLKERLPRTSAAVMVLDDEWSDVARWPTGNLDCSTLGLRSDNLSYVIYTSGSTGKPKGVMIEHRNVTRLLAATEKWFHFNGEDVWTLFHSFSFDFSVWELWGALAYGGRLVIVPYQTARSPEDFYRLICSEAVTVLNQTPSAFAQLIGAQASSTEPHSLRVVIFGGEALDPRMLSSWVERNGVNRPRLINMYGITETTVHVTYHPLSKADVESGNKSVIGRAIPDLRTYLFDSAGQPVPVGVVGEIYVGGAGVARGYLNRPELTVGRFVADPFGCEPGARLYRTGDLGRWRTDGNIEYLGRNDHQVKIRGFRIELGEIETQLAQHPQVREAAVLAREDGGGEKCLVGYVTVDLPRLKQRRQSAASDARMIDQWKTLYEETYSSGGSGPTFVGWNSSYTGQPIPEEEMREWLENTLERIRALRPRKVFEIGCGVGLLLQHLAPRCEVYDGTDLSETAIESLRSWTRTRSDLGHVRLVQGSAHDLRIPEAGCYDTVILNSVVQYFPDIDYLRAVLKAAMDLLAPGGTIFVGDVRHLGLLEAFHSSVQFARAAPETRATTLKDSVARAVELEKELVIHPQFFAELSKEFPALGNARILLKRGSSQNELTRYRYDVVLELSESPTIDFEEDTIWTPGSCSAAELVTRSMDKNLTSFRIRGIANRRLVRDLTAAHLIDMAEASLTADKLRDQLEKVEVNGEFPEKLGQLSQRYGYDTRLSWKSGHEEGRFDLECTIRERGATRRTAALGQNAPYEKVGSTRTFRQRYANDPLAATLKHELVAKLRDYSKDRLPAHMVPSAFVVLESFPLSPNGKLDRRALPAPTLTAHATRDYDAPQGDVESVLAEIWQDLLRLEQVGRRDNFFELGGHSLLIVRMLERLRQAGLPVAGHHVFENPVLADLAGTLHRESVAPADIPPNRIPMGCEAITPAMLPLVQLLPEHIDLIVHSVPGGAPNIQDIYPLAPLQEGILFHHILRPDGGDPYVVPILISLSSPQCLNDLTAALQAVIDRHDVLRTAILWDQLPGPVQVVCRRALLPVQDLILDAGQSSLHRLMRPEQQRLDLRRAPLMRLQVARTAHETQLFAILQLHHLVCDQKSLNNAIAEIRAHLSGHARALPSPFPYRNHIALSLAYSRTENAQDFFARKLGDCHETTAPFGLTDVHGDLSNIEEASLPLGPGMSEKIRVQARRFGVSTATLFHAAFALVIGCTSARDDVVFGSVLLGRLRGGAGIEKALGMFVNTLPLRLRLRGMSAHDLVSHTHRELTELLGHDQGSLAVAQRCSGLIGATPLFSALLNFRHNGSPTTVLSLAPGITLAEQKSGSNYPLTLNVDDLGGEFRLVAQTDRRADPTRFARYVATAMSSLSEALEELRQTPALSLPILPKSERHEVLEAFNATQAPYPQQKRIHELFESQARSTPQAVAVIYEGDSLTYAELNAKANQLARYLKQQSVRRGDYVPIVMPRCLEMLIGQLAVLKSGGVYVPTDPALPLERQLFIIQDCGARCVLGNGTHPGGVPQSLRWIDCAAAAREITQLQATNLPPEQGTPILPAYVMYTSGSTGLPKGVVVPHHAVNRLVINNRYARIDPTDCIAHCSNTAFDASTFEIWAGLLNGARVLIVPERVVLEARDLCEILTRHRVTILWLTSGLFTQYAPSLGGVFGQLRYLITGGDVVDPKIARRVLQHNPPRHLLNGYGPTECTTFSTTFTIEAIEEDTQSIPIGRPIANAQIYILDDRLQPLPIGVTGELYIAGAGVAQGYLNRPQLTAERFIANPFSTDPLSRLYKTGDLGRWRPDGAIEYLGRNDQQVKIRGFRIEPGEIEAHLARNPQVREAAVLARQDVPGDKRLVAYIITDEASLQAQSLRSYLKTLLPDHMIPAAFVNLGSWPLTPNGKLDRKALPVPEEGAYARREYEAPEGEVEEILAEIWQKLLRLERVGRDDNFFELGGHSLLGIKLMASVEKHFALKAPVITVFRHPTIREMALLIASMLAHQTESASGVVTSSSSATDIPLRPRLKSDRIPLTFAQRWFWQVGQRAERQSARIGYRALRLSGPLDYDALQRSFAALLRRHEALRIRIVNADGFLHQLIQEPEACEFAVFDLTDLAPDQREKEAQRLAEQLVLEPYVATEGPLFAARLFKVGPLEHRLVFAMDHIITDGASLQILVDDFCALCTQVACGLPPSLAPMPIQFADYAVWEQRTSAAWIENHNAYWTERLAGAQSLQLFPNQTSPGGSADTRNLVAYPIQFGKALSAEVAAFSRQERTTSAMSFLTAFFALVLCWSGKSDIVILFNTLGRLHNELDNVIGSLATPLYLRIQLRQEDTLLELLRRIYEEYTTAHSHHDCGRLAAQVPAPAFERNPFFNWIPQKIFRDPVESVAVPTEASALKIEPYDLQVPLRQDIAWSPEILLILFDEPEGVSGRFQYWVDHAPRDAFERFANAYRLLTEKLVRAPQTPVVAAWESICGQHSS